MSAARDAGTPATGLPSVGPCREPVLHAPETPIALDRAVWLRQGRDVALLATGPVLGRALVAAEELAARGISASVGSFPGIRPLDERAVCDAARQHRAILTIEEHNIYGGFGSRVAETMLAAGLAPRFGKWGVTEAMLGHVGAQGWLLDRLGSALPRAALKRSGLKYRNPGSLRLCLQITFCQFTESGIYSLVTSVNLPKSLSNQEILSAGHAAA